MKIVVTGAASGIGRAVVLDRASQNDMLTILDRDAERLHQLQTQLGDACHCAAVLDLASANIEQLVADGSWPHSSSDSAPYDAIVHCAGIGGWSDLANLNMSQWDQILNTNVRGAVFLTKALLPFLRAPGGVIVLVGSDSAVQGFPRRSAYSASKAALRGFGNALREELRPKGVRVTTLLPARVDTAFNGGVAGRRPDAVHPEDVASAVSLVLGVRQGTEFPEISISSVRYPFGS